MYDFYLKQPIVVGRARIDCTTFIITLYMHARLLYYSTFYHTHYRTDTYCNILLRKEHPEYLFLIRVQVFSLLLVLYGVVAKNKRERRQQSWSTACKEIVYTIRGEARLVRVVKRT